MSGIATAINTTNTLANVTSNIVNTTAAIGSCVNQYPFFAMLCPFYPELIPTAAKTTFLVSRFLILGLLCRLTQETNSIKSVQIAEQTIFESPTEKILYNSLDEALQNSLIRFKLSAKLVPNPDAAKMAGETLTEVAALNGYVRTEVLKKFAEENKIRYT